MYDVVRAFPPWREQTWRMPSQAIINLRLKNPTAVSRSQPPEGIESKGFCSHHLAQPERFGLPQLVHEANKRYQRFVSINLVVR